MFENKKKKNKLVLFVGGAAIITAGALTLSRCSFNEENEKDNKKNLDTTTTTSNSIVTEVSKSETPIIVTTIPVTSNTEYTTTTVVTTKPEEEIVIEDLKPVVIKNTAEDLVKLSRSFATYVNKTATLSHENYKFEEIKPEDLYSVIYLANIETFDKEETERLIENGIISDNILNNVADSFYFYELYADDTINKIAEGKTNIIDLSMIMSDEKGQEVAKTMNGIMTGSINATKEQNTKNYMDTVFYYAEGVTFAENDYDYRKSIYSTDRDALSVGADYTLSYAASCIDEIFKMKGVATKTYSDIMYEGRVDFSNVVQVFNGCMLEEQKTEDKVNTLK